MTRIPEQLRRNFLARADQYIFSEDDLPEEVIQISPLVSEAWALSSMNQEDRLSVFEIEFDAVAAEMLSSGLSMKQRQELFDICRRLLCL